MDCRLEDEGLKAGAAVEVGEGAETGAGRKVLDSWTFVRVGFVVVGFDPVPAVGDVVVAR